MAAQTLPPQGTTTCSGDSCIHPFSWPLHNVRIRGSFLLLCTSCVLKQHPTCFCPCCFKLIDSSAVASSIVHCSRCPAVSHVSCLPSSSSSTTSFLCPQCSTPNPASFSFFPAGPRRITTTDASVLVAAAQISSASMRKIAASSATEAERKTRDSVFTRRRAREMLEGTIAIARRERDREAGRDDLKRKAAAAAAAAALLEHKKDLNKLTKLQDPLSGSVTRVSKEETTGKITARNKTN